MEGPGVHHDDLAGAVSVDIGHAGVLEQRRGGVIAAFVEDGPGRAVVDAEQRLATEEELVRAVRVHVPGRAARHAGVVVAVDAPHQRPVGLEHGERVVVVHADLGVAVPVEVGHARRRGAVSTGDRERRELGAVRVVEIPLVTRDHEHLGARVSVGVEQGREVPVARAAVGPEPGAARVVHLVADEDLLAPVLVEVPNHRRSVEHRARGRQREQARPVGPGDHPLVHDDLDATVAFEVGDRDLGVARQCQRGGGPEDGAGTVHGGHAVVHRDADDLRHAVAGDVGQRHAARRDEPGNPEELPRSRRRRAGRGWPSTLRSRHGDCASGPGIRSRHDEHLRPGWDWTRRGPPTGPGTGSVRRSIRRRRARRALPSRDRPRPTAAPKPQGPGLLR